MLPANLRNLSDDELANFIEDRTDPLIQELVRRLQGLEHLATIKDLEHQIEVYENEESQAENDLELANERIHILEDYIRENKLEVPG